MASSSLFSLLLLGIYIACAHCSSIATIKQYHLCQECKTIKKTSFGGLLYIPDPKTNCTLDDAFYIRKGYANVTTIGLLFNVIRRIYNETAPTCRSEFCECARSYEFHDYDDHRVIFDNSALLNEFRKIALDFIAKYRQYLSSDAEIKKNLDRHGIPYPTVLVRIFKDHDYTYSRIFAYNDQVPRGEFYYPWGMNRNQNHTLQLSCLMATYFSNRAVVITPTNAQLEARLGCDMINVLGKPGEVQRFYFVNQWATAYPRLNLAGQTLAALFDKVNKSAAAFKPAVVYSEISFSAHYNRMNNRQELMLRGYKTENLVNTFSNTSNFTMCLFNSPTLRIDAQRIISNFTESSLGWVNFTFISDSGSTKPSTLTFNIAHNTVLTSAQNGTTVKSSAGTNVYTILGTEKTIEIYHINSTSQIIYRLGREVKISSPIRFLDSATGGVMINGFTANGSGPKSG